MIKPSEMAPATEKLILELFGKYFDAGLLKAVHADQIKME